jgi:hypothetical protein
MKLRWRFGLVAAIFLTIFSLYPQMKLWYVRGHEWQGNYAYNDIDEVAYASYVKALADGRPRKNDPYTGHDDSPDHPQPESLFSIQFAAPYTLAIPGRIFGISTPWMMTIGGAVAAFLTALLIFWFLFRLTGNNWYAMAGSLVTIAGGALFAGEGAISEVLFGGFSYPYFPGFRRYIPALAMPAFFGLVGLVWSRLGSDEPFENSNDSDSTFPKSIGIPWWVTYGLSLLAFAYAVFSYFYIWTTAVAWLLCFGLCWLIARPDGSARGLRWLTGLAVGCIVILLPYAYLLSKRSHAMDDVQLLVRTHAPDLTRFPEYIAVAVLMVIAFGVAMRKIKLRSSATVLVSSFALAVFVVFNQQIVTGQSLQPIHYQVFIGNYVAGLALVSAVGLFVRRSAIPDHVAAKIAVAVLALVAVGWGFVECHYTVRVLDDVNLARDEQMPLARRLNELAKDDPDPHKTVVLDFAIAEADDLPTVAPQATLWSRHLHIFTTVTQQENKERYYQFLYYQGVTGQQLANAMKNGDFVSMIALFGWGRHTDRLNSDFKPLTYGEVDAEARNYDNYCLSFDPHGSPETVPRYLVFRQEDAPDLTNFDRWFDRDQGEKYGPFVLYKVALK